MPYSLTETTESKEVIKWNQLIVYFAERNQKELFGLRTDIQEGNAIVD